MKKAMITRYSEIAEGMNLEYILVKNVIDSYIEFCKNYLKDGHRVVLIGLCSIVPDDEREEYAVTPAYICQQVADLYGYSYITVSNIVFQFMDNAVQDVKDHRDTTIRGLCTLHTGKNQNGKYLIHTSSSYTLLQELKSIGSNARVKTFKGLKLAVNGG